MDNGYCLLTSPGNAVWSVLDPDGGGEKDIPIGTLYQGGSWNHDGDSATPSVMAVLRSTEKSQVWDGKALSSWAGEVLCLAAHPLDKNTLYAGGWRASGPDRYTRIMAFFRSTDAGSTWTDISPVSYGLAQAVWIDPDKPEHVFLGSHTGVWSSTDGGMSWASPSAVFSVLALAADRRASNRVFAGTEAGVYFTSDEGKHWTSLGGGFPDAIMQCMDMDTVNRVLYAGTYDYGIVRLVLETRVEDDFTQGAGISGFALHPNHPNPFNSATQITYTSGRAGKVRLTVHDVKGRWIRTLVNALEGPGDKTVFWRGEDENGLRLPSGIYFLRLTTEEGFLTRKAVLAQ
jgi:hypothetical protein